MIRIRDAKITDVAWLLDELRSFDRFFGMQTKSLVPTDDAAAMETVAHLVDTQPFFIAEHAGSGDHHGRDAATPVGFIVGMLHTQFWNPAIMQLSELAWWVAPDMRGSSAGARLLEHFTAYGRKHADIVTMSVLENTPLAPQALEKRGFHKHETSYLMEVKSR